MRSLKILLVDDETELLEVLKSMLEAVGHSVEIRVNGKEALEACRRIDFDFILTDERMPGGNGIEFIIKLSAEKKQLPPVALMTGFTDVNLAEAKDFGIIKVFHKPFPLKSLIEFISSL